MLKSQYQVAELNIARKRYLLESVEMHGFVSRLDEINALAETSEGFVWRLQTPEGDATSLRVFDDDKLIVNMSVWESVEALYQYSYYTAHAQVFKERKNWFEKLEQPYFVMWWIPAGHIPTTQEAQAKLRHLQEYGPSKEAFTFKKRFEP